MSVDKNTLIGYTVIAFILTIGHALAQGVTWFDPSNPEKAYTLITSDFVSGPLGNLESDRVNRDGMMAYEEGNNDMLEQPLLIQDTECGSYAVSRGVNYSFPHLQNALAL